MKALFLKILTISEFLAKIDFFGTFWPKLKKNKA